MFSSSGFYRGFCSCSYRALKEIKILSFDLWKLGLRFTLCVCVSGVLLNQCVVTLGRYSEDWFLLSFETCLSFKSFSPTFGHCLNFNIVRSEFF
mgnify:CR=1 FL=1